MIAEAKNNSKKNAKNFDLDLEWKKKGVPLQSRSGNERQLIEIMIETSSILEESMRCIRQHEIH